MKERGSKCLVKNFSENMRSLTRVWKIRKKGTFWTVIVNLVVMGGVGILYLLMSGFMETLTKGAPLPGIVPAVGLVLLFVLLSFVTHLQQYKATYGLVYNEVKTTRLGLAERLRKLPLDISENGIWRILRRPSWEM